MSPDLPPLPVQVEPLPYEARLDTRQRSQIDLVVIHCTELPDLAAARRAGEQIHYPGSGTGNSGHFYIDRDGTVLQYIDVERIAHHTRGYNPRSIGIELVNTGRYPDWLASHAQAMDEPYTDAQIDALIKLLQRLQAEHATLRFIGGHEDLDTTEVPATDDPARTVFRKRDPGPLFPWARVMQAVKLERLSPNP